MAVQRTQGVGGEEEEADELGSVEELGGEELPLFLPTPSLMISAGED